MSWVACAVGGAVVSTASSYLKLHSGGYVPPVYFQPCHYCTKAPDEGQKEARCTSCGAPLKEKERSS